ncbi:MAG: YhcB family protein [Desulfobulbaceae bacterium]|nr:YhcB family protein [Desulfobulbaceae bacterium]
MADVNWELIILIIVVGLIVFAGMGIFIGTRISSDKRRIKELEGELVDARKDLEVYRSKVNSHFKKTSELFTQMTSSYKAVYLHLAEGSQELCTTDAALLNPSNGEFLKVSHAEMKQENEAVEKPVPTVEQTAQPETRSNEAPQQEKTEKSEKEDEAIVNEEKKVEGKEEPAGPVPTVEERKEL